LILFIAIRYAGTGTINIVGNGASAAVVYAPNATADFKGNAAFYGSVIAAHLKDVGNGAIHYDIALKEEAVHRGESHSQFVYLEQVLTLTRLKTDR